MALRLTTAEFLDWLLLWAIRDGVDRYLFRIDENADCELLAWIRGERFELTPPCKEEIEALSAELARMEAVADPRVKKERPANPTGASLSQVGGFLYPIGDRKVPVVYRVRWSKWGVAELKFRLSPVADLADVAQARMDELSPPHS